MMNSVMSNVDLSMFVGSFVNHKVFGTGTVSDFHDNKLTVKFSNKSCDFVYPDSFEKFVSFSDESMQETAVSLAVSKREKTEAKKKEAIEERIARLKIEDDPEKKSKNGRKKMPSQKWLNKGDSFKTHTDVLNECFGFAYKRFQQGMKVLDDGYAVWFPGIAKEENGQYVSLKSSGGWVNILSDDETRINEQNEDIEKNVEKEYDEDYDRIVFAKYEDEYTFIGVFREEHSSDPKETGFNYHLVGTALNLYTMEVA